MVNIFQRIEALEKELSILKAQLSWEQMTLPKCILEGYIAVNDYLAIVPSKEFGWELTLKPVDVETQKLDLIPCKWEDIKPGDILLYKDYDGDTIANDISYYAVKQNEDSFIFTDPNGGVIVGSQDYSESWEYYKVVYEGGEGIFEGDQRNND